MTTERYWTEQELRLRLNDYENELRTAGKARNTINTYVQHPERFINWLVGGYTPRAATLPTSDAAARPSSKYEPLRAYLSTCDEPVIRLTFSQIERILQTNLPTSARKYRPWWANELDGTHIHARAWIDAGRKTANVDMNAEAVDFVR
jgi:hypothetical protein